MHSLDDTFVAFGQDAQGRHFPLAVRGADTLERILTALEANAVLAPGQMVLIDQLYSLDAARLQTAGGGAPQVAPGLMAEGTIIAQARDQRGFILHHVVDGTTSLADLFAYLQSELQIPDIRTAWIGRARLRSTPRRYAN